MSRFLLVDGISSNTTKMNFINMDYLNLVKVDSVARSMMFITSYEVFQEFSFDNLSQQDIDGITAKLVQFGFITDGDYFINPESIMCFAFDEGSMLFNVSFFNGFRVLTLNGDNLFPYLTDNAQDQIKLTQQG